MNTTTSDRQPALLPSEEARMLPRCVTRYKWDQVFVFGVGFRFTQPSRLSTAIHSHYQYAIQSLNPL